jgi:hypothetical protein
VTPLNSLRNKCSWPFIYYDFVNTFIQASEPRLLVEIGVGLGLHAHHILSHNPYLIYWGIDPYTFGYDNSDQFCIDVATEYQLSGQAAMDQLYSDILTDLSHSYHSRAFLTRQPSKLASSLFLDKAIEFLFIDGDHTYDAVYFNLLMWYPKVKANGLIVGDDYRWPQVSRAVTDATNIFCINFNILHTPDGYPLYLIKK